MGSTDGRDSLVEMSTYHGQPLGELYSFASLNTVAFYPFWMLRIAQFDYGNKLLFVSGCMSIYNGLAEL